MKRFIYFLVPLALLICLAFTTPVCAAPSVYLNGQYLTFDVSPQVENNRTLVPVRAIFEALDAEVLWDENTSTVTACKGNINVRLQPGNKQALVNNQVVLLEVPAQAVAGRIMVPLRFVSEVLGADVDWDATSNAIYIDIRQSDPVQPPAVDSDHPRDPREIYKAVSPAVVTIYTFDCDDSLLVSGSGFIVNPDGTIVTNYHVIESACSAVVCLPDGSEYEVDHIMDYSQQEDIAVLKINASGLPVVKLGNSDLIENGEKIFTISSPGGLGNTMSDGLVSNKFRQLDGYSFIQISAPISPGSSGGALLNSQGEVIGITTAGFSQAQNVNFAVPINLVRPYLLTDHYIYLAAGRYQRKNHYLRKFTMNGSPIMSFSWRTGWNWELLW